MEWLADERRLAFFPAGTIFRDRFSPSRISGMSRIVFEPAQNLAHVS